LRIDTSTTSVERFDPGKKEYQVNVVPNPSSDDVTFAFQILKSEIIQLKIYDLFGHERYTRKETADEGRHEMIWKAHGLSQGIFVYKLLIGQKMFSGKVIIQ
jgi:hypothetical protein